MWRVTFILVIAMSEKLTVTILAALDQTNGNEKWVEPLVNVFGVVKVRGITYEISGDYRWTRTDNAVYDRKTHRETERRTFWLQHDRKYRRVSNDQPPGYRSPAFYALEDRVQDALTQFTRSHPEWQRESFRRRLQVLIAKAEYEALRAAAESDKHNREAKRLRLELERV